MFVKLTKKDGSPVWLNANFIVTVESVRGGGSIVVPVGDGLDYEVSENVEKILPVIEKAQGAVAIVPVPTIFSPSQTTYICPSFARCFSVSALCVCFKRSIYSGG